MFENSIGSIIVVDENSKPLGIFTGRDLLRVIAQGVSLEIPVGEVMTRDPIVVKVNDDIIKAATIMSEHRIRHLSVIGEKGELVGVLSIRDIVDALKSILASESAESEMGMFTS